MFAYLADIFIVIYFGVGLDVSYAEAAAEVENGSLKALVLPHFCDKIKHDIRRVAERVNVENLRADMAVVAL